MGDYYHGRWAAFLARTQRAVVDGICITPPFFAAFRRAMIRRGQVWCRQTSASMSMSEKTRQGASADTDTDTDTGAGTGAVHSSSSSHTYPSEPRGDVLALVSALHTKYTRFRDEQFYLVLNGGHMLPVESESTLIIANVTLVSLLYSCIVALLHFFNATYLNVPYFNFTSFCLFLFQIHVVHVVHFRALPITATMV